jgi:hypothetical protein
MGKGKKAASAVWSKMLRFNMFAQGIGFTVEGGLGAKGSPLGLIVSILIAGILLVYGFQKHLDLLNGTENTF